MTWIAPYAISMRNTLRDDRLQLIPLFTGSQRRSFRGVDSGQLESSGVPSPGR